MADNFRVGQRLSYDGALCTVRYVGRVGDTKGEWLGVEWDDVLRGKHSGEHEGKKYFECKFPNSGSFIRPTRKPDTPLSFIEGLKKKYTTADDPPGRHAEISLTATKVVEEVGFEKMVQKLSQLQELKIILLDGLQIDRVDAVDVIRATCPNIEELDISRNRFEKLEDIALVCSALPKLKSLRISGNRFNDLAVSNSTAFSNIISLEIANLLLFWDELSILLQLFPNATMLIAPHNNISSIPTGHSFPPPLTALDLSYNAFTILSSITPLSAMEKLKTLILSHNIISSLSTPPGTVFPALTRLDLAYNAIPTFAALDALPVATPALTSLRISHNPLYSSVTPDEGHMLTIGRLPNGVKILNHSTITPKERENAEIWYLGRIAKEVAGARDREAVLVRHRRWDELCKLHGEPAVADASSGEKTLAARLIEMVFVGREKEVQRKIPRSMPVSTLRGCVGRWFGVDPMSVRLVCSFGDGEEVELGSMEDTREVGMWVERGKVRVAVQGTPYGTS